MPEPELAGWEHTIFDSGIYTYFVAWSGRGLGVTRISTSLLPAPTPNEPMTFLVFQRVNASLYQALISRRAAYRK